MHGLVLQGVLALLAFQAVRIVKHRRLFKCLWQYVCCGPHNTTRLLQSYVVLVFC